ncbi:hypothetical protein [Phaeacidiphilus oryzae]|uniref:hypothetical protein n=1 Tax=Phaeacidiphilus oryzae TaxID=348818 RepID=UPI0005633B9F|nr:hypothetical protein [Phaeacidiphilus oryzae]
MAELLEFDDLAQVESLLKASITFKFDGTEEAQIFVMSPIYGAALGRLRDGLFDAMRSGGESGKIERVSAWYRLSHHTHRWHFVVRSAKAHPKWGVMDAAERREWVEVVASPFTVDDDVFAEIERLAVDDV